MKKRTGRTRPPGRSQSAGEGGGTKWRLRLYVAGETSRSVIALANLKNICEAHLKGSYSIEVIDLLEHPHLAKRDQIFAIPTLIRKLPTPMKKIIGDLSVTERVLVGLEMERE